MRRDWSGKIIQQLALLGSLSRGWSRSWSTNKGNKTGVNQFFDQKPFGLGGYLVAPLLILTWPRLYTNKLEKILNLGGGTKLGGS